MHGPGLPIGDIDLSVVVAGGDRVSDPDPLTGGGGEGVAGPAGDDADAVGAVVETGDLVAGAAITSCPWEASIARASCRSTSLAWMTT